MADESNDSVWDRLRQHWKLVLILGALATGLAATVFQLDLFGIGDAERGAYDSGLQAFTADNSAGASQSAWQRFSGLFKKKPKKSDDIVVIAIDDATFIGVSKDAWMRTQYGSWPYSRNIWAQVFQYLHDHGARAVVFDAALDETSTNQQDDREMARIIGKTGLSFAAGFSVTADPNVPSLPAVEAVNQLTAKELPDVQVTEDDPFGEAVQKDAAVVTTLPDDVVAKALAFPVRTEGGFQLAELRPTASQIEDVPGKLRPKELMTPVRPIEPLLQVTPAWGTVVPEMDSDGKIRRTQFAYTDGANNYVTLTVAIAADLFGAKDVTLRPGQLQIGDRSWRINATDAEIDYGGSLRDRFPIYTLFSVLSDVKAQIALDEKRATPDQVQWSLKGDEFRNKVVFIGGFATGTGDVKSTPLEANVPGVVKHAAELDSLLSGRFITEAPYWVSLLVALVVALFSAALILVVRSTPLEILWPIALFFGFFLVTGALLVYTKVHVLSAMPSLAGSAASVFATAVNHLFADKRLEQTRKMLSRYMEPELVKQMMQKGEVPALGGENREITAFFSDIRGFSGFSEMWRNDPQQLVAFLNQYLTRVSHVLHEHRGCVDKYIGDAVVCLFGAPFTDTEHARHACEAALAVREEIDKMREEFRKQGLPDVYTRIGLNSDVMLVGNIGSEQMFDYTAMGDGMNLAARLEGANKNYDTVIMMGENTYRMAKEFVEARELDRVRVAGKNVPVAVFEVLALKGKLAPEKRQVVTLYGQALTLYRDARFQEALQVLDEALEMDPHDGPSATLKKRCQKYVANPPALPFDGISNLEK